MCSIADDLGISFQLPTTRFALLTFKLTFFNLTEHFNDRTQASNIFQQLSLSSFVIIKWAIQADHPDNCILLSSPNKNIVLWLPLSIFNLCKCQRARHWTPTVSF